MMKFGLLTAILDGWSFEEVVDIASEMGFKCLEVACWPDGKAERRYAGVSHIDCERICEDDEYAKYVLDLVASKGLEISSLAFYPNTMDPNMEKREAAITHLKAVIRASSKLGVGMVTTFIGKDQHKTVEENIELFRKVWPGLIALAEENGVKVAIENCPMLFGADQWPGGQNLMCTPVIYRKLFEIIPSPNFGLNFDPSHYVWQGLDYPDRNFTFGGTIVSNGDVGYERRKDKDRLNHTGTNHGSIECVGGQWYVFYHRLTHQSDYSRQACAEKITILPDGSIPQVEITSCGLNNGPLEGVGTYPAVICCNLTNGRMRHGSNQKKAYDAPQVTSLCGERFVGDIGNKTLIGYKYFSLKENTVLTVSVRGDFSGMLEVCTAIDSASIASIRLEPSVAWRSFSANVPVQQGIYPIYFRFNGKGKAELLEFTLV